MKSGVALQTVLSVKSPPEPDATHSAGEVARDREEIRRNEAPYWEAILDAVPAQIALIDSMGTIVSVNGGWKQFGEANGLWGGTYAVGANYLTVCEQARGPFAQEAAAAAQGIRLVLDGARDSFQLEYPCHSPTQQRWFLLRATAVAKGPLQGAVLMHTDITLRVTAAQALAKLSLATGRRERMLNSALSSITDFVYLIDAGGRLLFANQKTLDLWGVSLDQAIGSNARDLGYSSDAAAKLQAQVQSVFATGVSVRDEMAYTSADGREGFYGYVLSPALGPDGSVEFLVGSTQDITERKRSELALRESAAQFQTLAAAIPQIVLVSDRQRQMIYLNQQWTDYTGLRLAQSVDDGWKAAIHPQDRARVEQARRECASGHYSYEARLRRADGVYRWWLVRVVCLTDPDGAVLKWIGTWTDIDDLKLAQMEVSRINQELQRKQVELRTLLDVVPARIWFKDTNARIVLANERAASSTGLTVAQMEGLPIADVYPSEKAAQYRASDLEIIRTGKPALGVLERETGPSGTETWIQKDKVPFRDERGDIVGIVVMSHDITERKRDQDALRDLNTDLEDRVRRRTAELNLARDEAERANRAKSDFLATMSHEIRTPMSGFLGLLELLGLSTLDAEQRSTLGLARESGNALLQIIDDVLDFSKIEANSLELNLVAASVPSVIGNLCRLHAQVASSKNVTLLCDVSPEISPYLLFDPLRLGQIVNNFLNNAIMFTAAGEVAISVQQLGRRGDVEELRFVVADTGIGMTPQQVGKLFQPFVQAAADTSGQFGGTGLGLVISRRLAELMGGTVEVESEFGVGTSMSLKLAFEVCDTGTPVRPGNAGQDELDAFMKGRRGAPSIAQAEADHTLLLIVDDHPTNRLVLMRQVASLGYAAEAYTDGVEALTAWQSGRFGAVITDCNMPRMNGYDLASAIRAAEWEQGRARIPILACTANALAAATQQCLAMGMDDCLVKPASLAEVGAKLDQWIPLVRGQGAERPAVGAPSEVVGSGPGQGLLDLGLLDEISGGDPVAQAEMLLEFRRVNETDAAALRAAAALDDFPQLAQFSHRIKGSSLMMGATLLGQVCGRIEAAAAARDRGALSASMDLFEIELLRLHRHLEMFPTARKKH